MNEFEPLGPECCCHSERRRRRFYYCPLYYGLCYADPLPEAELRFRRSWKSEKSWTLSIFREELHHYCREEAYGGGAEKPKLLRQMVQRRLAREATALEHRDFEQDVKLVSALREIEFGSATLGEIYPRVKATLHRWCDAWEQSVLPWELLKSGMHNHLELPAPLQFVLRETVFYLTPVTAFLLEGKIELIGWHSDKEEMNRVSELLHCYTRYGLQRSPEQARVRFYDPETGSLTAAPIPDKPFAQALNGWVQDAELWQSVLTDYRTSPTLLLKYANPYHCPQCRFRDLCPKTLAEQRQD